MPAAFRAFARVEPNSESPWIHGGYRCGLDQLRALLARCVFEGRWAEQQGGSLGQALDLWIARELRRAGYEADAVWPRETEPRVLPAGIARAIGRLPARDRDSAAVRRITALAGATSPVVHGEFFAKSVDVLVADWDRGVEPLISTKAMTGSFGKNLTNRWEEFAGDLRNLRGRFPLSVLGIVYLADASIVEREPGTWMRLQDMLRKLRMETAPSRAYDATTLILATPVASDGAQLAMTDVPEDLRPNQFFESMLSRAFERLPVSERAAARELYGRRLLPTAEATPQGGPTGPEGG